MPLLAGRTVLITVAKADDKTLRVNFIPTLALLARLFRYGEISYHGGFINLATGATSVLRIDPQCWKRTGRLNRRTTPLWRRQEEGSHGRANEGRVAGTDRRT
jgi:hypothetical protein